MSTIENALALPIRRNVSGLQLGIGAAVTAIGTALAVEFLVSAL
ncbi:MAG TPA: hypothetical protein VMQ93_18410 [Novosphingobium sp.]|nr:hypothetical protein [Novosphingobium sp.]